MAAGNMAIRSNAYGKNWTWEFNILCGSFLIVYFCLGILISSSLAAEMPSSCDRKHTCQQIRLGKPRKNSIPGPPRCQSQRQTLSLLRSLVNPLITVAEINQSKFHRNLCGKGDKVWNQEKKKEARSP